MPPRPVSPSTPGTTSTQPTVIPDFVTDPVQSLRPWPIEVTCLDRVWTIPALPAADWLNVLMADGASVEAVFPGLAGDEAMVEVDNALWDERLDLMDLHDLAREVIGVAAGRPWWVALRLIQATAHAWNYVGVEFATRTDANRMSLSAWLDVALHTLLRAMNKDNHTMFLSRLELPPADVEIPEPEISVDAFTKMMNDE